MHVSLFSMSIKQKQTSKRKLTILLAALAIMAGAGGLYILRDSSHVAAGAETSVDLNTAGQAKSPFSFNAGSTNGWYTGPANETSLAVFGKNSKAKEVNETYFAYIHYKNDGLSKAEWLKKLEDRSKDYPDYDLMRGDILTATLKTNNGSIDYELHTYRNQLREDVAPNSYDGLNEAEVHGYIPYKTGYFEIQGYATPENLLPEVIEAIQAFSFDQNKQTF